MKRFAGLTVLAIALIAAALAHAAIKTFKGGVVHDGRATVSLKVRAKDGNPSKLLGVQRVHFNRVPIRHVVKHRCQRRTSNVTVATRSTIHEEGFFRIERTNRAGSTLTVRGHFSPSHKRAEGWLRIHVPHQCDTRRVNWRVRR